MTDSETSNHMSSPLLRLPAELRLRTYEWVLGGEVYHIKSIVRPMALSRGAQWVVCALPEGWKDGIDGTSHDHEDCKNGHPVLKHGHFPLLRTCRQIHPEACIVPYTANVIHSWSAGNFDFATFIKKNCPQVLKRVYLSINRMAQVEQTFQLLAQCEQLNELSVDFASPWIAEKLFFDVLVEEPQTHPFLQLQNLKRWGCYWDNDPIYFWHDVEIEYNMSISACDRLLARQESLKMKLIKTETYI